jgi:hypothetical protein
MQTLPEALALLEREALWKLHDPGLSGIQTQFSCKYIAILWITDLKSNGLNL